MNRYVFSIALVAGILMITLLTACGFPPYDGDHYQQQAEMGRSLNHFEHDVDDGRVVYGVHAGESQSKQAVLFIHGAPGDWKAWGRYLGDEDLNNQTFMIAVDRPGYAGSNAGGEEINLQNQAQWIMQAAQAFHPGPFVVVSHSYGGPIAMQIAIDYPNDVAKNIVLAGAIDPDLHQARWYHKIANSNILQWVLPGPMNVATQEMLALPKSLLEQQKHLDAITAPTLVIQGEKDWLVPMSNADYATDRLVSSKVVTRVLPGQGHFLPWEQYDLVKEMILRSTYQEN
jgi:pimeloyl-ACP methyl ester carboxylesterase